MLGKGCIECTVGRVSNTRLAIIPIYRRWPSQESKTTSFKLLRTYQYLMPSPKLNWSIIHPKDRRQQRYDRALQVVKPGLGRATQRNIDLSIMVYPDFYAGS
uniref:Uncharacterized protein n=1 Tax=Coccidioides posadasii RMSCC 3488 TaxID=454284 RepID=A0A0J6FQ74_COCPO|nr:hypothetical protein CPAG_08842 [Coccidioides posadasii RMSCC 3488]